MDITFVKSPNFSAGRRFGGGINRIDRVVIHSIVGNLEHADREFKNPLRRASAHYAVDGTRVHQYVLEKDTAFHAGTWKPVGFYNNIRSIGIETQGGGSFGAMREDTFETTVRLVHEICNRHGIPVDREHVKGHREMPGTATACPSGAEVDRIVEAVIALREREAVRPSLPDPVPTPPPTVHEPRRVPVFPMTVTVTAATLRVRTAPSTAAPTARPYPSVGRSVGITAITVTDAVDGQAIDGNGKWLRTIRGNFVWSGGTNFTKYL